MESDLTNYANSSGDSFFNSIYPKGILKEIVEQSSPIEVSFSAAAFLAENAGTRVMDIGSGIGKFCLAGAALFPKTHFYGIEQQKYRVDCAKEAKLKLGIQNATFIHANFTRLDFSKYDNFYFYSFNKADLYGCGDKFVNELECSQDLYLAYKNHIRSVLEKCKEGTRLATYAHCEDIVPESYKRLNKDANTLLKLWIK